MIVTEAPPAELDDIPKWWMVVLALPQLSMTSLTLLLNVHLISLYSRLGASLALMTLFITIARSTDAITDPGVSWLTDSGLLNLCWRPGVRRKPFMLVGPFLYDISMVLLLGTPFDFGDNGVAWAVWYGVVQTFFYLGDTLCSIPLSALLPAMSTNNNTRESIFMWSRGVNSLGILIAALLPVPLGWMLRADSCYDLHCAACPVALPTNTTQHSGLSPGAYADCRTACESVCDVLASRMAFRYVGIAFAAWHFVTMYLVIFLIPEPGVEMLLFEAKQAERLKRMTADARTDGDHPRSRPGSRAPAHLRVLTRQASRGCPACCSRSQAAAAPTVPCCSTLPDRWALKCTARPDDPEVTAPVVRKEPIVAALQKTLRNSAFTSLIPATVLDMVAFTLIGTSMKLYVDYVVRPLDVPACASGSRTILGFTSTLFCTSTDVWLGLALFALMLSMIGFIPVWRYLSQLFGTRSTWLAFNIVGAFTTGLFVFAGEGAPIPAVILSFVNGIPQAAMFLNDAILSTTIDYDAVINQGERAEARFSMFSSLTPKLASVPAQALPLSILAAIGFREPVRGALQEQPSFVKNYISAMFFVFPTIITIISWLAKLTFPIRFQEQLDRISHNYRLLTGQAECAWHEAVLLRDPLDPSLAGELSRERPWCTACRPRAVQQQHRAANAGIVPVLVEGSGTDLIHSGAEDLPPPHALIPQSKTASGTPAPVTKRSESDGLRQRGGAGVVSAQPGGTPAPGSRAHAPKHTIRVYPRVELTDANRDAFNVFDQFNVHELGAWRVFGLKFLREKTSRARNCRVTLVASFAVAAAAQVALGMLEQSQMSWLPTVTMLALGLTLGLAIMSHLKLGACEELNTGTCGGPAGPHFAKWLQANAMALRLNALELELVDASHATAIRQHEAEDRAPRPGGGRRGSWDGRMRGASIAEGGPPAGEAHGGSARTAPREPPPEGGTGPSAADGKLGPSGGVRAAGASPVHRIRTEPDVLQAGAGATGVVVGARGWDEGEAAGTGSGRLPGLVSLAGSGAELQEFGGVSGQGSLSGRSVPAPDSRGSQSPRGARLSAGARPRASGAGRT